MFASQGDSLRADIARVELCLDQRFTAGLQAMEARLLGRVEEVETITKQSRADISVLTERIDKLEARPAAQDTPAPPPRPNGWIQHTVISGGWPEGLRGTALQWALARRTDGDWEHMERSWLSLLAILGILTLDQAGGRSMLVLHSPAFGSVGLRTPVTAGSVLGDGSIGEEVCEVLCRLRLRRGSARAPRTASGQHWSGQAHITGARRDQAWLDASLRGFPGMTVQHLTRLHALLKPAEDVKRVDAMSARRSPMLGFQGWPTSCSQTLGCSTKSLGLYDSDSEGDSDIKEHFTELKRKAEVRRARSGALEKSGAAAQLGMPSPGQAANSSASSSAHPQRTFVPRSASGYSGASTSLAPTEVLDF